MKVVMSGVYITAKTTKRSGLTETSFSGVLLTLSTARLTPEKAGNVTNS